MSMAVAAPRGMRHINDVQPERLAGVKLFRGVYARGEDLLTLDKAEPGCFDNARFVECDLDTTVWPAELNDVTVVDSSLRDTVWHLKHGENIRILGTVRIPVTISADNEMTADLTRIRARVDRMQVEGYAPGFTMIQCAGDDVHFGPVDDWTEDRSRTEEEAGTRG